MGICLWVVATGCGEAMARGPRARLFRVCGQVTVEKGRNMRSLFRMSLFLASFISLQGGLLAQNKLFIDPLTVKVGDKGVSVPVLLDNDQGLFGFSLSLVTDNALLKLTNLDLNGTPISDAGWSFGQVLDGGGRLSWGVVLDVT